MGVLDGWRFCPRCAGPVGVDGGAASCGSCGFVAYASSQPTACALVVDGEGRVLLARRNAAVFDGYWDLPGGFLEEGEHPLDALRRELREETGLEVEPVHFVGVWMDWYAQGDDRDGVPATLNLYWTARVTGGQPVAADDVRELRWFAPAELPGADEIAFRNVAEVIAAWRERRPA